jgi:para-aminobenzoate synthetase component I
MFQPYVAMSPGCSVTPCHTGSERDRWTWRLGEPGDPYAQLAGFLAGYGLGLPRPVPGDPAGHDQREICGAHLFVSAAASAAAIGAPPGAPSPVDGLPDLVAVVYAHDPGNPPGVGDPGRAQRFQLGAWQPSWTESAHAAAIREVRAAIARGDVYQVNVVGHASAGYRGDPAVALAEVSGLPGARYPVRLAGDGWWVACASPETLLSVQDGMVVTRPIKGTATATEAGRAALLRSAKERAEHVMIVDLARNDLARVARTGTVGVDELFAVRRWCDLWQAESVVRAELAGDVGLPELLRAVCPGGSVTGAPKLAAVDMIARLEPVGRGAAMGALGWLDADRLDLGLTIRTVAADTDRLHLWAGGGITWGSRPAAEVAEAAAKAAPLRAALRRSAG